jgi:hypothetical protein
MKFDKIIQRLLPHDESFYAFFEDASQNLVNGAALIKELEHHGGRGHDVRYRDTVGLCREDRRRMDPDDTLRGRRCGCFI